ncbi:MAG: hypothetical protein ACFFC7_09135 [Candidatus Hermodarchaeota archaeon]
MSCPVAVRFHQPVIIISCAVGGSPPGEGVPAIGGLNERLSKVLFLSSIRLIPLSCPVAVRFHQPVIIISCAVGGSRPG